MNQIDTNLIYDVGMFYGEDTKLYLDMGYRVVAIEANEKICRKVLRRFKKYIDAGKLIVLNIGISDKTEEKTFYINPVMPEFSSFDPVQADYNNQWQLISQKVQTTTIDKILEKYGVPFYLKSDIEGSDLVLLKSMHSNMKPQYISVEIKPEYFNEILQELCRLGYTKFKLINQYTHLALSNEFNYEIQNMKLFEKIYLACKINPSIPFKILRLIKFDKLIPKIFDVGKLLYFKPGASGLFGEKTDGVWHDQKSIVEIFKISLKHQQTNKTQTGQDYWVDLHATF